MQPNPGSTGVLCGHCPDGFARDSYPDYCQICPDDPGSVLAAAQIYLLYFFFVLTWQMKPCQRYMGYHGIVCSNLLSRFSAKLGIISDLVQKSVMNFVVAVMAATTAVKGGVKLHTSIIRSLDDR